MTTNTSTLPSIPVWSKAIQDSQSKFLDCNMLDFYQEQIFATQLLMNNDYLKELAINNSTSLKLAMYNVAAIVLTLNPSQGLAFLVPRKGKVILDISYRGLINIGVETGTINWAKPELVYEKDHFTYNGPANMPEHRCDPFSKDRGDVVGGYCIASLTSGGVMVETMSTVDMEQIKRSSEAFKKGYGPWVEWESQMQLKSIVKRASKWWPKSTPRMAKAMQVLNEENGEGLSELVTDNVIELPVSPDPKDVPVQIKKEVAKYLKRAKESGAFEACAELMRERITQPEYLAYALTQLEESKEDKPIN